MLKNYNFSVVRDFAMMYRSNLHKLGRAKVHSHCPLQTTCWIIRPSTTVLFLIFTSHVSNSCPKLLSILFYLVWVIYPVGQTPSGHMCYLELASWGLHIHVARQPFPRNRGVHMLFPRPLKEPHRSFFHLYWSHSCCHLRLDSVRHLHAGELKGPARCPHSQLLLPMVHCVSPGPSKYLSMILQISY